MHTVERHEDSYGSLKKKGCLDFIILMVDRTRRETLDYAMTFMDGLLILDDGGHDEDNKDKSLIPSICILLNHYDAIHSVNENDNDDASENTSIITLQEVQAIIKTKKSNAQIKCLDACMKNGYGLEALNAYITLPYLQMKKKDLMMQLDRVKNGLKDWDEKFEEASFVPFCELEELFRENVTNAKVDVEEEVVEVVNLEKSKDAVKDSPTAPVASAEVNSKQDHGAEQTNGQKEKEQQQQQQYETNQQQSGRRKIMPTGEKDTIQKVSSKDSIKKKKKDKASSDRRKGTQTTRISSDSMTKTEQKSRLRNENTRENQRGSRRKQKVAPVAVYKDPKQALEAFLASDDESDNDANTDAALPASCAGSINGNFGIYRNMAVLDSDDSDSSIDDHIRAKGLPKKRSTKILPVVKKYDDKEHIGLKADAPSSRDGSDLRTVQQQVEEKVYSSDADTAQTIVTNDKKEVYSKLRKPSTANIRVLKTGESISPNNTESSIASSNQPVEEDRVTDGETEKASVQVTVDLDQPPLAVQQTNDASEQPINGDDGSVISVEVNTDGESPTYNASEGEDNDTNSVDEGLITKTNDIASEIQEVDEEEPKDDQMVDTSGSNEMEQEKEAHIDEVDDLRHELGANADDHNIIQQATQARDPNNEVEDENSTCPQSNHVEDDISGARIKDSGDNKGPQKIKACVTEDDSTADDTDTICGEGKQLQGDVPIQDSHRDANEKKQQDISDASDNDDGGGVSTSAPPPPTSTEPVPRNHHQVDSESDDDCFMVTEESDQASSLQISYRKMMKHTKVKDPASGSKDKHPDGKEINEAVRAAIAAAQKEAESMLVSEKKSGKSKKKSSKKDIKSEDSSKKKKKKKKKVEG